MASKPHPSEPTGREGRLAFLDTLATELPRFLPGQRWFGARTRAASAVGLVDAGVVPDTDGILALFEVTLADGATERYAIPVRPGHDPATLPDATDDPGFGLALLDRLREGTAIPGLHGTFRFTPTGALAEFLPERPRQVTRLRSEQSNTSLVYDRSAILKLFRRLQAGPHPELEITEYLTTATDFREAPRLGGSIVWDPDHGAGPIVLAVLEEYVVNQGDGWSVTQERLAEFLAAAAGSGSAPADAAFARTLAAADAREAAHLGATTGRLHMALASATEDSLAPEPITETDLAGWLGEMDAQVDRVLPMLAAAGPAIPAPRQEGVERLLADPGRLRDGLRAIRALGEGGVTKIRVHGDYHLGQVLKAADRFVILDFEGEPLRSMAERRARQSALKDVAGMLRSYAYAARAALRRAVDAQPALPSLAERLGSWVDRWEESVRSAFLEAYLDETLAHGAGFLPRGRAALEAVLRAYELDKAVYELRYELGHRPDWVGLPLEGLERLLADAGGPAGHLRTGEGPFRFMACLEIREFVGVRAEDERQLGELIEEAPLDSIYFHTHGFFLRHKFTAGAYANDFATWVAQELRDRALAERLAMVDPGDCPTLEALRDELAAIIDDHLRDLPVVPRVVFGEPFDFVQSRVVEIPTGREARTLEEFRQALLDVDASAIYFHLVEARMRLGRGQNDFASWLDRGLGLPALAARVQAIDPYGGTLERVRARLVQLCDEALSEGAGA